MKFRNVGLIMDMGDVLDAHRTGSLHLLYIPNQSKLLSSM